MSGFVCERRTGPGTVVPKTQTTSSATAHFQRFSPRWSAMWAPHRLKPRPHCLEPRRHRHPMRGIALHGGSTRRRHAPGRLRVVQNPHHYPWCIAPSLVRGCLTGAGPLGGVLINVGRASPAMTGDVMVGQLREGACVRWGVTPDREDSTPSDRVESSLTGRMFPIRWNPSDGAQPIGGAVARAR